MYHLVVAIRFSFKPTVATHEKLGSFASVVDEREEHQNTTGPDLAGGLAGESAQRKTLRPR